MKNKELFRMINAAAENDIPNVIERIDLAKIDILPDEKALRSPRFTLQSILTYALSSLLVIIGLFWAMIELSTDNVPNYTPLETEAEIIGYQTLSATTLLEGLEPIELGYSLLASTEIAEESEIAGEIATINAYVNMMEITLGAENELTYRLQESDLAEYQTMISFNGQGLAGETISYRFYYNAEDQEGKRVFQGVISFLDHEYPANGEIATAGAPEIRSTFHVAIDAENYVEIDDVSTDTNQTYSYRIYKSNILQNAATIKLNASKNSLRAEIAYQSRGNSFRLEVEKNRSQNALTIRYQVAGAKAEAGSIAVGLEYDEESGTYSYRYQIKNAAGTPQGEYNGNRRNKTRSGGSDDDGTTTEVPGTDDNDDGTTTEVPGTDDDDDSTNPGPGPGPGDQTPGKGNSL